MKDLFRNQKIKRILSSFLVFVVIITTFFHSDITDANADSNDRRRTVIKLAQGAQLTEMEELQDLSYDDLRLFALYLSNYYIPFGTKFDKMNLDSEENKELVEFMTQSLSNNVGLDESLAQYLSQVSMQSTIETARQLYIPYNALKVIQMYATLANYNNNWKDGDMSDWNEGNWNESGSGTIHQAMPDSTIEQDKSNSSLESDAGDMASFNGCVGTYGSGIFSAGHPNSLYINQLASYASYIGQENGGIKTVNGVEYIPLSYSMFLQIFDLAKRIEKWDATMQGYYVSKDACDDEVFSSFSGIVSNSKYNSDKKNYIYDYTNYPDSEYDGTQDGFLYYHHLFNAKDNKGNYVFRYLRDYNFSQKKATLYSTSNNTIYNIAETCFMPIVWIDETDPANPKANTVFSNNEACLHAMTLVYNTLNMKYGYGSSFTSLPISELSQYDKADILKLTAYAATMYTDWVGNICIWNGITYQVVIPAAINPYTFSELTDYSYDMNVTYAQREQAATQAKITSFQGNKVNLLNFISLSKEGQDLVGIQPFVAPSGQSKAKNYYFMGIRNSAYSAGYSMFTLECWRIGPGVEAIQMDQSFGSGWGNYQCLADAFEISGDCFSIDGTGNDDYVAFPSAYHVKKSTMYSTKLKGGTYRVNLAMYGFDDSGWNSEGALWIQNGSTSTEDKVTYEDWGQIRWSTRFCSQFGNGDCGALATSLFVDNLAGVGNATDLTSFFKQDNAFTLSTLASKLGSVSFSSVQKAGATANYFEGNINEVLAQSLFLTYAFAYYNGAADAKEYIEADHIVNLRFNASLFPSGEGNLDFSQVVPIEDTTEDEVLSMVYYLLHPSEGISYFATWIKNKVGGLFIGWHEDIVGSSDSNSSLGMTQYLGTSGYATTPNLSDIGWIESLLDGYDNIIVYILIILAIIMLCYIILGQLSVQRAVIGFVMFGICAFLPPYIMNFTINTSNNVADRIFTEKFDYWALVQTEEYLGQLQGYYNAMDAGDSTEGLAYLIAMNSTSGGQNSETGYGSMRVKWISPKKYSDLAELTEALNSNTSTNLLVKNASDNMKSLVISSIASTTSGEDFSGADGLYLYRDILDIYRAGAITYNVMAQQSNSSITHGDISTEAQAYLNISNMSATISVNNLANKTYDSASAGKLPNYYDLINYDSDGVDNTGDVDNYISSFEAMNKGFIPSTSAATNSSQNYYTNKNLATTYLVGYHNKYYEIYEKYYEAANNSGAIDISWTGALDWPAFQKTLFANPNVSGFNYGTGHIVSAITGLAADGESPTDVVTTKDNLDSLYYAMYSESPYYFLNYQVRDVLRANGLYSYDMENPTGIHTGDATNSMITLFLKDNQAYFYNYKNNEGYGELRDYLNMHDFFYLVMPSLRANADIIRWFDKQYTFNTYATCSLRRQMNGSFKYNGVTIINPDGEWNKAEVGEFNDWYKALNEQERYEFWHDLNVNLLCYYSCTWLDAMLDCEYAEPEKIKIGADNYTVQDPLDPYSYFETDASGNIIKGRPMIFSRSEMRYYGLQEHNLTIVEKKLIELNDNVYKKSLELTNYYTLSDETLIHAYSMICLFEFNNIFSETNPFGEDYILYPLGYELKAVTYDGYLRLMLYASSGEDLMYNDADGNKSIYTRIQEKTSIFFGIGLVVNDLFAVYALPALKLFFLILLFLTSILIIIAGAIKLDLNLINVIWKSLLAPMLSFAAVSIGLCIVSSLFMSNGASGVYESAPVIALGDPTALILVQLVINIVVLILYWKMVKKAFKDFKTYVTSVFNDIAGAVTGALGKIATVATGAHVVNKLSKGAKERGNANTSAGGSGGSGGGAGAAAAGVVGGAALTASAAEASSQEQREKAATDQKAYNDKATADRQAKSEAKVNKAEDKVLDKAEKSQNKADKLSGKADAAQDKIKENRAKRNAIKNNKNLTDEEKEKQIAKLNKSSASLAKKRDKLRSRSSKVEERGNNAFEKGVTRTDKMRTKMKDKNEKLAARNTNRNAKIDRNIQKSAHKSTQKQAKLATQEAKQARKNLVKRRK